MRKAADGRQTFGDFLKTEYRETAKIFVTPGYKTVTSIRTTQEQETQYFISVLRKGSETPAVSGRSPIGHRPIRPFHDSERRGQSEMRGNIDPNKTPKMDTVVVRNVRIPDTGRRHVQPIQLRSTEWMAQEISDDTIRTR